MKAFNGRSLLAMTFVLLAAPANAQWKNVAPNLVPQGPQRGAMQFRDGVVWTGSTTLWSSHDKGQTWQQSLAFPASKIFDIAFFDKLNGLVATEDEILVTNDGGKTWKNSLSGGDFRKVGFNGSASTLHAVDYDGGFYTSTDGGLNWSTFSIGIDARSFAIASDHTIYLQTTIPVGGQPIGTVCQSTDLGYTWSIGGAQFQYDCYTVAVDSCDSKRLYLVNEQIVLPTDMVAKIYLSTDGGQSWKFTDSHEEPYYSGALSTNNDAVFLGVSDASGLRRSMDKGLTWKSIGGPAIGVDARNIAVVNDNTVLATDTAGSIWLTTNGGGDSVQSGPAGTLSLAPKQLFDSDTAGCDSVVRSIQILKSGCPIPSINSVKLAGIDSASFSIESIEADSISIALRPGIPGDQNASLLVNLDNGTSDTVHLSGFVAAYVGTVALSPVSLFAGDTLHCDSLTFPLYISSLGCHPPPMSKIFIGGKDSDSFHIVDSTSDSIAVEWTSQKPGAQQAWLIALLADGTRDSVVLAGFSTTTPLLFSVSPQPSLFFRDSSYVNCGSRSDMIRISANACLWPNVKSERIVGVDSMDYSIVTPIAPFSASDSVRIVFTPQDSGIRFAAYQLTLDNDTVITIPLAGVGISPYNLTLSATSLSEKTDTIGGTVAVPIIVDGLARAETIELVLHYPLADLVYDGSFDPAGTKVDIPGEQWPGRSKLRIMGVQDSAIAAYARFDVFSDTSYTPQVTFDSLNVPTQLGPCEYVLPPMATATIMPIQGCGIQMLSRWVHLGEKPVFGIRPNPTNGEITITSSLDVGETTIEVYDMLGMRRGYYQSSLAKGVPLALSLLLPSGIYYVRVASEAGETNIPIVVEQ